MLKDLFQDYKRLNAYIISMSTGRPVIILPTALLWLNLTDVKRDYIQSYFNLNIISLKNNIVSICKYHKYNMFYNWL